MESAVAANTPAFEAAAREAVRSALEENRDTLNAELGNLSATVEAVIHRKLDAFVERANKLAASTNATMAEEVARVEREANASVALKQGLVDNLGKQVGR